MCVPSVTDNLTVRCGQHLYIASQEAMRKEDFLHGRTFESSNSPRAGVKANNDIFLGARLKGLLWKKSKDDCSTYNLQNSVVLSTKSGWIVYPILEVGSKKVMQVLESMDTVISGFDGK